MFISSLDLDCKLIEIEQKARLVIMPALAYSLFLYTYCIPSLHWLSHVFFTPSFPSHSLMKALLWNGSKEAVCWCSWLPPHPPTIGLITQYWPCYCGRILNSYCEVHHRTKRVLVVPHALYCKLDFTPACTAIAQVFCPFVFYSRFRIITCIQLRKSRGMPLGEAVCESCHKGQ